VPHDILLVPLLTGLAVALTIEKRFALVTRIKWPNDVLINNKKVAGILCVAKKEFILLGVGVNCNQSSFSSNVSHAASLTDFINRRINRQYLLSALLSGIQTVFDSSDWRSEIEKHLFLLGQKCKVRFHEGNTVKEKTGMVMGIGEHGELQFKPDDDETARLIVSGEVCPLGDQKTVIE
jgi:BirA family biotin operon repressor/biotin-[acetyl-CoA-carboxylase] ligase